RPAAPASGRRPRRSNEPAGSSRGPSRRGSAPISRSPPTRPSPDDRRSSRPPPGRADVAAGLFELRKDAITGWWVATVVDRAFDRDRFARAADPIDDGGDCQNCRLPAGDGVRLRTLKDFAFHVIGTDEQARELDGSVAQVSL